MIWRWRWWASRRSRTQRLRASSCFWAGGAMDHDSAVAKGCDEKRVQGAGRMRRHRAGKDSV